MTTPYDQEGAAARLRWGRRGARAALAAGDVLVVVDVLSFSTATALALAAGVEVIPAAPGAAAAQRAAELGALLARKRGAGGPSLSPASLRELPAGTRLVLPSPNGSFCSQLAGGATPLFTGALVNARAAARAARAAAERSGRAVSVLACGERWGEPDPDDGGLRVALEDALGAGAVLDALGLPCSAEAEHCRLAFAGARAAGRVEDLVRESGSGRELIQRGFALDVELASQLDRVALAPRLRGGSFRVSPAPREQPGQPGQAGAASAGGAPAGPSRA